LATLEIAMPLPIPSCLEDLSNEDILDIAWEPEFLAQATPLERTLLQRLGEQCHALASAREECRHLMNSHWNLC
jgi:hypothetical protein